MLFLDEVNRATPEVMQCAFQLVLDRELNGNKLHPETPALLRRFWVADLEPTVSDWKNWAKENGIDEIIIDFIHHNEAHLRHSGQMEPGKTYPNPASWERIDQSLKHAGVCLADCAGRSTPPGLYALSTGFVGMEASISFQDFIKGYALQISAEDILNDYKKNSATIEKLSPAKHNALIEKLVNHCRDNEWKVSQAKNACTFIKSLPGEMIVSFFNNVMETNNVPNIRTVHKFIGMKVVEIVTASEKI